ncbi:LCP family protein [Cryobacterium frigoriphilum]|nr:LCP family protein [Cryobacterium frigoriphilum]
MSDQLRPRSNGSKNLSTIARHGRLKRSSAFATIAKLLAAGLAVVMVSGVSVAAIATFDVANSAQDGIVLDIEDGAAEVPQINAIEGGVNVLVVGSDSRVGQDAVFGDSDSLGTLNDVTMLLHISEDHQNASVISFPRDMFVPIPSCTGPDGDTYNAMSRQKINTTLTYGGLACTVLTVEKLTGLDIPYAAEVQFSGVMAMSTAVGGVPVCVAEDIEDVQSDTFLPAGEHTLEGYAALQFLRTRHGVGDGSDLTRINNQQLFMSSLVRQIKSSETLSDWTKVYSLAKAVTSNMSLSTSLNNVDTIVSIALALKDIDLDKVVFAQTPTNLTDGGVLPAQPAFKDMFTALSNDEAIELSGSTGGGTVADPNAPVTAEPEATEAPATDAAPVDPEATTDPSVEPTEEPDDGVTTLSESVTGQTAGDYTCTAGRTLRDQ